MKTLPFVRQSALGLAALFLLAFGFYLRALSPAFHPDDSPETITAAATLSIQHPPGYPLHSLLGRLAVVLGPGAAPFNVNALAAFFAALSLLLAAILLYELGREFAPWAASRGTLAGLALAGALALGASWSLFFQATIAKGGIYTLNLALSFGALWAALRARGALLAAPAGAGIAASFWSALGLLLLLFGLGVANHWTSQAVLVPGFALLLMEGFWVRRPRWTRADALKAGLWALIPLSGLALYLFLPIRSRLGAPLIWSDAGSLKDLLWVFTRSQYAGAEAGKSLASFLALLQRIGLNVVQDWTPLGLLALGGGWALLLRKRPWLALSLLSLPLTLALAVAWKANPPSDSYFIIDPYLVPLHGGLGLGLAGYAALPARRGQAAAGLLLLALGLAVWQWPRAEHRHDYLGYDYAKNLLLSAPKDALVFCEGDSNTAGPYVPRYVFGRRKDLSLLSSVLLDYPWYQRQQARLDPRLKFPPAPLGTPSADMAYMVKANAPRPALWTNSYTQAWVDEGALLHRGLLLRLQEERRPFKAARLLSQDLWPAYALRGVFQPQARRMDELSVRLVRDNYIESEGRLGQALQDGGAYAEARRRYQRLGILRPAWAAPWLQAGNQAWFMGDKTGAQADWQRAADAEPASAEAWANLGLAAFGQGRYDEAASLARKALSFDPDLGNAKELMQKALQASVSPPQAQAAQAGGSNEALRGDQLAQAGKLAEALKAYENALRLGYVNAAVHRNRGVMLGQLGRPAEAVPALAEARRLDPANAELMKLHGFFLFNSGKRPEGLAALEAARKAAPEDAEIKRLYEQAKGTAAP